MFHLRQQRDFLGLKFIHESHPQPPRNSSAANGSQLHRNMIRGLPIGLLVGILQKFPIRWIKLSVVFLIIVMQPTCQGIFAFVQQHIPRENVFPHSEGIDARAWLLLRDRGWQRIVGDK